MKTEHEYNAMFQALVDIRENLNATISSLYEHIRRAQLECVETSFQEQKDALAECVDGIDRKSVV